MASLRWSSTRSESGAQRSLKETFLHLHEDEKAQTVLRKLQIDRFEEGNDAMYASIKEMQD